MVAISALLVSSADYLRSVTLQFLFQDLDALRAPRRELLGLGREPAPHLVVPEVVGVLAGRGDVPVRQLLQILLIGAKGPRRRGRDRSEEHTSELQSLRHLVCR